MTVDGASDPTTHNSTTKQALGRLVSKAKKALPKSSTLKVKVISALVTSLTPKSRREVYCNSCKRLNIKELLFFFNNQT